MKQFIFLLYMIYMSIQDIKYRSISLKSTIGMAAALLAANCIQWGQGGFYLEWDDSIQSVENWIATAVLATVLMIYMLLTKSLGEGDVVVIVIAAAFIGCFYAVRMFLLAIMLLLMISVVGICMKKVKLKQQIPFMPYVLLGGLGAVIFV